MQRFMKIMEPTPDTRILDIGGGGFNWDIIQYVGDVVLLNIYKPTCMDTKYTYVQGDGTNLKFADAAFDITYSNSVIEHLSTYENQKKFAHEMWRVGRAIWCQTPARWFFVEPHYMTPFIHFFPKKWQKKLLRNFSVWGLITRPSQNYVDGMVDEIRLLTFREMKSLFPDCRIIKERFLFFTKSYIAVRKND